MPHAADRIRNVALVGHRGSGKTSLHEALLFEAGATTRLGSVADGTTVSDADEDEKSRGMSISASLASFEWRDTKVNLIDTPGEPSFIADAIARLPEREKLVVALYYYENLTLREIGEVLGVTESRISQLHTKAVLRLKSRLPVENLRE